MYASSICLRRVASRLDSVREELDHERGTAGPPLADVERSAGPEWAATAALRALTAELDEALAVISRLSGEAAEALRTCATAYEASDDRAARRLSPPRVAPWA